MVTISFLGRFYVWFSVQIFHGSNFRRGKCHEWYNFNSSINTQIFIIITLYIVCVKNIKYALLWPRIESQAQCSRCLYTIGLKNMAHYSFFITKQKTFIRCNWYKYESKLNSAQFCWRGLIMISRPSVMKLSSSPLKSRDKILDHRASNHVPGRSGIDKKQHICIKVYLTDTTNSKLIKQ